MVSSHSSTTAAGRHPTDPWPLVGRDEELAYVAAAVARPGPGSVVLAGRPGAGRSRLAREAFCSARSNGFATEWFVASRAAASIPFGAFARLLHTADPGTTSDEALGLLGSWAATLEREEQAGRRTTRAARE